MNKDALDFIYDEEKEQLTAFSDEPLIIENKQLGYRVGYYLEQFVMDYSTNLSGYFGYTIFKSIKPKNERRARTIERNRKSTYEGSTAHFFKSLYADRLKEEGFVVRLSRERLDKRIVAYDEKNVFGTLKTGQARDYKGLSFENYLTVLYLREEEPVEYTATLESQLGSGLIIPRPSDNKPFQESRVLILEGSSAIDFESNGYIRNPMSFYSLGYWAFEKVADMVPLDYNPEVNN